MSLKSKVPGETGEMEEPETRDVQILLTSKEDPVSMRSVGVSGVLLLSFFLVGATLYYTLCLNLAQVNLDNEIFWCLFFYCILHAVSTGKSMDLFDFCNQISSFLFCYSEVALVIVGSIHIEACENSRNHHCCFKDQG